MIIKTNQNQKKEVINYPKLTLNKTINILEFKVDPILVLVFSFLTCDL